MRILLLLLLPTLAHAQTWTTVDSPKQPLNFASAGSNYTWSHPFVNPSPAGTYEVSNAIVDKSHRVGAWSQPARITVKSGWLLYGGSWNQPPTSDEAGIAWKIKCIAVNETADFKNGSEHYLQTSYEVNSVTPWSGSSPEIQALHLLWQRFQTIAKLPLSLSTQSASPPVVVMSQFPNVSCEVAYCRVTESGETALSPPVQYTPAILPGMIPAETVQIQLLIQEPHPQGTIGYHVYWRPVTGDGPEPKALENRDIYHFGQLKMPISVLWSPGKSSRVENKAFLHVFENYKGVFDGPLPGIKNGQKINTPDFSDVSTADTTQLTTDLHRLRFECTLPYCSGMRGPNSGSYVHQFQRLGNNMLACLTQGISTWHGAIKPIVSISTPQWQRLPAPHCYGDPATADDWLWQIWDKQPKVVRTVANAPIHTPAAKPQSRLCDLQLQLMNRTGNITVPAGVAYETYCPVIDEWRNEGASNTFGRQIKAADGGKWWIKPQASLGGHTRWPAIGVYNQYSTWLGVQTNGAIAFADWSGGQSFGVRFNDCAAGGGLSIHSRCAGSSTNLGGHTASELEFTNCTFAGEVPIWIGGVQSANLRFKRTHAHSNSNSRRGSGVFLSTGNQIRFTEGLYVECPQGGSIIRGTDYPVNLLVDDIWVDQGFHCFLETSHTTCTVKFRGGKLNCWAHDPFEELTLARLIDSPPALSRLIFEDVQVQFNFTPAIDVVSPHYNLCELRFTDTVLADHSILREPTKAQEQARANVIYPWGYPAVPTREVPGLRLSANSSVNSMTNRSKVQRDNWTAEAVKP